MYFNIFGGSALLHILAAHPKVVAAFGLVATVAMLASPVGYGAYPGTTEFASQLEEIAATYGEVDTAAVETARRASVKLAEMPREVVRQAVNEVLASCRDHCAGVTTATVLDDANLRSKVLFIYELNRMAAAHASAAGDERRRSTTGAAQTKR